MVCTRGKSEGTIIVASKWTYSKIIQPVKCLHIYFYYLLCSRIRGVSLCSLMYYWAIIHRFNVATAEREATFPFFSSWSCTMLSSWDTICCCSVYRLLRRPLAAMLWRSSRCSPLWSSIKDLQSLQQEAGSVAAQVRQPGDADSCPRETVLQFVWLFFKHLLIYFLFHFYSLVSFSH